MNDILKQRLVGALILLALGVVFWPIIFAPQDRPQITDQPAFPAPPAVVTEPLPSPDAAGLRASPTLEPTGEAAVAPGPEALQASAESPAATESVSSEFATAPPDDADATPQGQAAREEPPQKLGMDSAGVPVAWTLQVATVSVAAKAEELRVKLLALNHKAYVTTLSSGGKNLYRVSIGPKFERAELEKLQAGIDAQFGVKTMVVRYLP